MSSAFALLLLGGILSPLLWGRTLFKPVTVALLVVAAFVAGHPIGLAGFAPSAAGLYFTRLVLIVLAAVVLHGRDDLTRTQTLLLGGAMAALLQSASLLSFLIAFEAVSLLSVVLVSRIRTPDEAEGAVKIFIAGAVATGVLMFGATLYLLGGGDLLAPPQSAETPLRQVGLWTIFLALLYKLTVVPMHTWAPDTYAKVHADHAALLSGAAKTSVAVGAFLLFAPALEATGASAPIVLTLAIVTMSVGNIMALFQRELGRMLAWSSVAHAGYLLLAFAAVRSPLALTGLVAMATAYLFMQSAAFLALGPLRDAGRETLDRLAGLGRVHPAFALALTVQIFSLAGIPLLAGFLGKALLFYSVVDAGWWWAALVALLNSALSVGYYAWIVKQLWFDPPQERNRTWLTITPAMRLAYAILLAGTLFFGLYVPSGLSGVM